MKRALIVSKVPSPFIAEIAEAVTGCKFGWEMDVWFSKGLGHRGAHWGECVYSERVKFAEQSLASDKCATNWKQLLGGKKYDVIISLWPLHARDTWYLKQLKTAFGAKLIFWHEPPIPRNWLVWNGKKLNYRILSRWLGIDMVWAIGHKAFEYWPKVIGVEGFLVPYFSRFSSDVLPPVKSGVVDKKVRFVFSGQLIDRNNVRGIVAAVEHLVQEGLGGRFEVILFGDGPLRNYVEETKERIGNEVLTIDAAIPGNWSSRLDWLRGADALLSPGKYSGWGLTIPEAMSLGVPVISTNGIESARYYIRDGVNGYRVSDNWADIGRVMRLFIEKRQLNSDMYEHCIEASRGGSAEVGAKAMLRIFELL